VGLQALRSRFGLDGLFESSVADGCFKAIGWPSILQRADFGLTTSEFAESQQRKHHEKEWFFPTTVGS
jgi:hypothetical protein